YKYRSKEKVLLPALAPFLGRIVCAFIWLNLGHNAQILGSIWLVIGLALYWLRRKKQGSDADPLTSRDA
ncbi:MAG: APC family permease, partial [Acidobacteriaceae bacterium]